MTKKGKKIPLKDLPSDKSEWDASPTFILTGVAFEWKEHPSVFGVCEPKDDPVFMAAYVFSKGDMEAYERYIENIKSRHSEEDNDG
jgi:hypothetical protein